jgi:4-amino-4-deoxy-L-arabinose transferase-like glycosyltransferase
VSTTDSTTTLNGAETPVAVATSLNVPRWSLRSWLERVQPQHAVLTGILGLSVVLNTHKLAQNGYANTFYSAGAKSMLRSWHNFLFVSFDPGGLVTIDKPPLAIWVQTVSAKLFGFSPLSLLLPEAIISTIAVAVLYRVLARRLGAMVGLVGALTLAVFPSFVAVSRDNGVDPLLILFMILACGCALNAIESGRWRSLLGSAVLVGLAFNTKTLAAYLVVPGIALGFAVCAPGSVLHRAKQLLVAGIAVGLVSFAWIALVELTPASQRPFVGSSTDNTEIGLTFDYNGFGRVEGEVGGPGRIPVAEGALVNPKAHIRPALNVNVTTLFGSPARKAPARPVSLNSVRSTAAPANAASATQVQANAASATQVRTNRLAHHRRAKPVRVKRVRVKRVRVKRVRVKRARLSPILPNGRYRNPIAFGGPTGPLRLFERELADQGSWMLPFALLSLIALALLAFAGERPRRNPRLSILIVFGGWLLTEATVLSLSKGIVHPYYISAMGPGVAAMSGAGAYAFTRFAQHRHWGFALLPCALVATIVAQLSIMHDERYMHWYAPVLIGCAAFGTIAMAVRRLAQPAMALVLGALLFVPAAYATTTWLAPVEGTFPAAGPHQASGTGNILGLSVRSTKVYLNMAGFLASHRAGTRWSVLSDASPTAAPLILLGSPAAALGGYSGTDPVLDGHSLARLVRLREDRYVVLGGAYSSRGGNLATKAVLRACRELPAGAWHGPKPSIHALVLFDCAGHARALEHA